MLNIHPALLPAFKGLDTHARALAAGAKKHGATVHFVVPEMDSGPIIAQAAVPVHDGDTEATLAARVLEVEHRIYPLALRLVAEGPRADRRRPLPDRRATGRDRSYAEPAIRPNASATVAITPPSACRVTFQAQRGNRVQQLAPAVDRRATIFDQQCRHERQSVTMRFAIGPTVAGAPPHALC